MRKGSDKLCLVCSKFGKRLSDQLLATVVGEMMLVKFKSQ